MSPLTATILYALVFGCGTPTRPQNARVAEPPHAPHLLDAPISIAPTAPDATMAQAPKNPPGGVPPTCRGAALVFDTEESENPCLVPNTGDDDLPPPPGPDDLEITAAVAEKSIAPGGTATVLVTMTNKTKAPMLLHVDYTCDEEAEFNIGVFDANKKRVDYISHKNCDTTTYGCTRRILGIALDPGGSMVKKRSFTAKVTRLAADCGDVPAGPIKRGSYVLRVVTGFRPAPDSPYHSRIDTTLVVR